MEKPDYVFLDLSTQQIETLRGMMRRCENGLEAISEVYVAPDGRAIALLRRNACPDMIFAVLDRTFPSASG